MGAFSYICVVGLSTVSAVCGSLLVLVLIPSRRLRFAVWDFYMSIYTTVILTALAPVTLFSFRNCKGFLPMAQVCKHLPRLLGVSWQIQHMDRLENVAGGVVVANHQCGLDLAGMHHVWKAIHPATVITKKELLYFVPAGPILWLTGLLFIDRKNPKASAKQLKEASDFIKKGVKIWFFPEGTRNTKKGELLPFKKGAFRMAIENQVPIMPIVSSHYSFIDYKNKNFNDGKIIMSVMDPIPTVGLTESDVDKLTNQVYDLMTKEFIRITDENER